MKVVEVAAGHGSLVKRYVAPKKNTGLIALCEQ